MSTTREQDAEFREAFDDLNHAARYIANCVVSGVDPGVEAVDAYAQAQGRMDRALDLLAAATLPEAIV